MKKLLLISALLFSFNGWAEDESHEIKIIDYEFLDENPAIGIKGAAGGVINLFCFDNRLFVSGMQNRSLRSGSIPILENTDQGISHRTCSSKEFKLLNSLDRKDYLKQIPGNRNGYRLIKACLSNSVFYVLPGYSYIQSFKDGLVEEC